ncbi:aspartate/glutamate racemase family protein [Neisseriaceae bacterium TC5R-5]|nr:aspartate/glutamate racemase family protein [Neisseriaceae bacterium TC5R-5]
MKTIGLLGGMSWESSTLYYQLINRAVQRRLGGLHSAKIILYSVDFAEIEALQRGGEWQEAGALLAQAALRLQQAGADFVVLCTNTMHKVAGQIEQASSLPLLHIADPTAQALLAAGVQKLALLGTAFTMEQAFYRERLIERYGLQVEIPDEAQRRDIHRIIYEELCLGKVLTTSRQRFVDIVNSMAARGCQAIILGCTEIGMLLSAGDTDLPLFDTTLLHAEAAADEALAEEHSPYRG